MHMPIELSLYEALTEAGVKPDSARRVERQVEAAITKVKRLFVPKCTIS